jgi:adenylyltransferase/sulfurtransferase
MLDVRPATQTALFSFPGATHVPFEQLEARLAEATQLAARAAQEAVSGPMPCAAPNGGGADGGGVSRQPLGNLVVLCRRGNNSQRVVERLRGAGVKNVIDLVGGVEAWIAQVDTHMPHL